MTLQEVDFKGRLSGRQQQRMKTLQEDKIGTDQPYLISIFVINCSIFRMHLTDVKWKENVNVVLGQNYRGLIASRQITKVSYSL